jgi:hypothetical protein
MKVILVSTMIREMTFSHHIQGKNIYIYICVCVCVCVTFIRRACVQIVPREYRNERVDIRPVPGALPPGKERARVSLVGCRVGHHGWGRCDVHPCGPAWERRSVGALLLVRGLRPVIRRHHHPRNPSPSCFYLRVILVGGFCSFSGNLGTVRLSTPSVRLPSIFLGSTVSSGSTKDRWKDP